MPGKTYLHNLFGLNNPGNTDSVIIYAEDKTPRLHYTCDFIFNHVLKLKYVITSDISEFNGLEKFRINYSRQKTDGVFQLVPHGLLSEKTITPVRPVPFIKEGMIYFYETKGKGDFSYDIFSAVFYFISRYEEWQDFKPDTHGRFEASSSILFQNKFHLKPVVDIWINEFAEKMKVVYPEILFPERIFKTISTIDVDNLYAYRAKGSTRTCGAMVKDILRLDFKNLWERMQVLAGNKKDPFDIYEDVSDFCFENKIPLIYFFLFRTGTRYDRTVNPESAAYTTVFETLKKNHALIGLHPSYYSSDDKNLLISEKDKLTKRTGKEITLTRQHYLRFNIRTTPRQLIENGFEVDFTMGFASEAGFRAGTSHPFYYYDFDAGQPEFKLLFVPFCLMDGAYTIYETTQPEKAYTEMLTIANEIKKVNGLFVTVFHERTFSDHLYKGYGTLYKKLHVALKEL